jgi:hypothetical protein
MCSPMMRVRCDVGGFDGGAPATMGGVGDNGLP